MYWVPSSTTRFGTVWGWRKDCGLVIVLDSMIIGAVVDSALALIGNTNGDY